MIADCIFNGDCPRSIAMAGNAVFKIVASSCCIKMAIASKIGRKGDGWIDWFAAIIICVSKTIGKL